MRKKQHWRIPPNRPLYDRFYLVTWTQQSDAINGTDYDAGEEVDAEEEDWQDWVEDEQDQASAGGALCIYCEYAPPNPNECFEHMSKVHGFDFFQIRTQLGLNVYESIAWINIARKCASECICIQCNVKFPSMAALLEHMNAEKHYFVPPGANTLKEPEYVS